MRSCRVIPTKLNMEILAFFAGITCIYNQSLLLSCCLVALFLFKRMTRVIVCCVFGAVWALFHQVHINSQQGYVGKDPWVEVSEWVTSLQTMSGRVQVELMAQRMNQQSVHTLIRVDCNHHCPLLKVGEGWHLKARLRETRTEISKAHHLRWTGKADGHSFQRISLTPSIRRNILQFRYRVAARLKKGDTCLETRSLLEALTLGLSHEIDERMWSLLRRT
ncbi:MAG: hypothetical protein B7X00_00165, partial [Legionella sp. 21-45-4]